MPIDTGQHLEIVYTTESLLIVTPKDDHTSMHMVITKIDHELSCLKHQNTTNNSDHTTNDSRHTFYEIINVVLMIILSTCTLIVHLLFKDLHISLFEKLLMFYNFALVITNSTFLSLQLMYHWITVNSQTVCYTATIVFISTFPCAGSFVTKSYINSFRLPYVSLLSPETRNF